MKISVVVPCYNEEQVIIETNRRLTENLKQYIEYEIVYVNDGSRDNTINILKNEAEKNKRIKIIDFSRNFGHQIAVTAGVEYSTGDAVIIIDADLQDPPEMIHKMIEKYREGYDVVYAVRKSRKGETFFKKITAKIYYRLLNNLTDVKFPQDTGDFRLISRRVCEKLKKMPEKDRYLRGMISWIGYNQIGIEYDRDERFAGETKYSLKKMIKLSLAGIISFSAKPLQISVYLGFIMALSSFFYMLYIIRNKFINQVQPGWTSLVVLILFTSGIQMILLGIVGEYIARIYEESKGRPIYIVKEEINIE